MLKKILLASCMVAVASGAQAQSFQSTEDAIIYRQSAFTLLAAHFSRLRPVVEGKVAYHPERVEEIADLVETLAELPWAGFGPGTAGGNSKKEIWANNRAFEEKRLDFIQNVKALQDAADEGNLDLIKQRFAAVGQSCRSCHESFRNKR